MKPDLSEKTIADFGAQWTIFVDNEGYYGSIEFLDTVFAASVSRRCQGRNGCGHRLGHRPVRAVYAVAVFWRKKLALCVADLMI
jgi:hypothetical protein